MHEAREDGWRTGSPDDLCECRVMQDGCKRIAYYDGSYFWIHKYHEMGPEAAFKKDYFEAQAIFPFKGLLWKPL